MENIPHAHPSPRVVNGVLEWYKGDTFSFNIVMDDLIDQDSVPVVLGDEDTVTVTFIKEKDGSVVKAFEFPQTGEEIQNNTVTLEFDGDVSGLFDSGCYLYNVTITHSNRVTLAWRNKAVVK